MRCHTKRTVIWHTKRENKDELQRCSACGRKVSPRYRASFLSDEKSSTQRLDKISKYAGRVRIKIYVKVFITSGIRRPTESVSHVGKEKFHVNYSFRACDFSSEFPLEFASVNYTMLASLLTHLRIVTSGTSLDTFTASIIIERV